MNDINDRGFFFVSWLVPCFFLRQAMSGRKHRTRRLGRHGLRAGGSQGAPLGVPRGPRRCGQGRDWFSVSGDVENDTQQHMIATGDIRHLSTIREQPWDGDFGHSDSGVYSIQQQLGGKTNTQRYHGMWIDKHATCFWEKTRFSEKT